jgi:hypothetical protein
LENVSAQKKGKIRQIYTRLKNTFIQKFPNCFGHKNDNFFFHKKIKNHCDNPKNNPIYFIISSMKERKGEKKGEIFFKKK